MPSSKSNAEALARAKKLINDFCEYEYRDPADFSDPSKVGIAYTTLTDDEMPVQVNVNLSAFCVDRYLNHRLVERNQYSSLNMLIEYELKDLSFDDLIYFTDSQYELAKRDVSGFDSPCADTQIYLNQAQRVEEYAVSGAVQSTEASPHYPAEGRLFKYIVAGREAYYLALRPYRGS